MGVMVAATIGLSITSPDAGAVVSLPDIAITLTGGTYPLHFLGQLPNAVVLIDNAGGLLFSGAGITLLLLTTALSALGTFAVTITEVIFPTFNEECSTPGDPEGIALIKGKFGLVATDLSPLNLGLLLTLTQFEIKCPMGPMIIVRGDVLGSISGIGSETNELASFASRFEGSNGEQYISEYYNDGGTKVRAELEAESGSGFVQVDEALGMTMYMSVLGSQMFTITGR
jgi:hypothetical protein